MLKLIEIFCAKLLSPSVRRAWIEISMAIFQQMGELGVTLREEGVD